MMRPPGEYVGPDTIGMDRALRHLERSHDDRRVKDALGRTKPLVRDAVTGEVVPCWHYRLECGHLEAVWTTPLPDTRTALFCGQETCRRDRRIVESFTDG